MGAFYRFKLGDFACVCISDGGMNYPVQGMFKDIPLDQAETILRRHALPTTHVYTPYTLLYIDTGAHKVLVDTGIGRYGKHAREMWPQVDNSGLSAGIYLDSLRQAGIRPEDIDTVIITHAHPDHIGGNLNENGELNLPNAQYFIWQAEWDFWFSDDLAAGMPSFFVKVARDNLSPLRERVTCLGSEVPIVPGISPVAAPGHTPGHIALSIVSSGKQLLHIADAAAHPIHLLYPDLLLPFDILPEQTLVSRRHICERAASDGALVFAHHFPPYPNLGQIIRQEAGWKWQPDAAAIA
jgi:glyoxylase-like metal-dependent hydrolase (beta-lactamase superfamily II)